MYSSLRSSTKYDAFAGLLETDDVSSVCLADDGDSVVFNSVVCRRQQKFIF